MFHVKAEEPVRNLFNKQNDTVLCKAANKVVGGGVICMEILIDNPRNMRKPVTKHSPALLEWRAMLPL